MDLFRSGIKSVLGAPPPSRESDIETVGNRNIALVEYRLPL